MAETRKRSTASKTAASKKSSQRSGAASRKSSGSTKRANANASRPATKSAARSSGSATAKASAQRANAAAQMGSNVLPFQSFNGDSMQDMLKQGATSFQDLQERLNEMSNGASENIAKTADTLSKTLEEAFDLSKDGIDATSEYTEECAAIINDAMQQLAELSSQQFSETVEQSKGIFSCRTLNDLFEWQNNMLRAQMDTTFRQMQQMSQLMFDLTEATEPLGQRITTATEKASRAISRIA